MSRLESHIRRLQAQCELINWAASELCGSVSLALDLGLGNGRTFSHLRERLPGWRIVAFDRQNAADPKSLAPDSEIVVGELQATLPKFAAAYPHGASLIHSDIGLSDPISSARQMAFISRVIPDLAAPAAIVLSDQELNHHCLLPLHPAVPILPGRYFSYRRAPIRQFTCPETLESDGDRLALTHA